MTRPKAFRCDVCQRETDQWGDLIIKRRWFTWPKDESWKRLNVCADCTNRILRHIRREIGVEEWYRDH